MKGLIPAVLITVVCSLDGGAQCVTQAKAIQTQVICSCTGKQVKTGGCQALDDPLNPSVCTYSGYRACGFQGETECDVAITSNGGFCDNISHPANPVAMKVVSDKGSTPWRENFMVFPIGNGLLVHTMPRRSIHGLRLNSNGNVISTAGSYKCVAFCASRYVYSVDFAP